eukprot:CAMPEP_0181028006 /NCGR_PEP_ID=MMETSP1070-20121207/4450_1 /TAXON_ID=265543 /ORGANISM="Minutocellus polymorphus, Strain NH13" /LENGTH=1109 /DNA_ID=CAMNT_0023105251 /DNA_START=257 /DNA_END=3586 /DNA_ORIENTATION=-
MAIGMSPSDSFDVDAEFENVFLRDETALADGDAQDPLDRIAASAAGSAGSTLLPSPGSLFTFSPGLGGLLGGGATAGTGGANQYAPVNAVQMELQDNAKLPTFNMTVDRSNAISPTRGLAMRRTGMGRSNSHGRLRGLSLGAGPAGGAGTTSAASTSATGGVAAGVSDATSRDVDEIVRLSENDMNLTEIFLGGSDRQSQSLAYSSNAGELLGTIGSRIGDKLDNIGTNHEQQQQDSATSGGDPDPILAAMSSSDAMDILAAMDDVDNDTSTTVASDVAESIPRSKKVKSGKPSSSLPASQSLPVGKGISHSVAANRPLARSAGVKRKAGPGKDSSAYVSAVSAASNQYRSMQSPYGRRVQLPIPTPTSTLTTKAATGTGDKPTKSVVASTTKANGVTSAQDDRSMAAAIATAARLATMAPQPQPGKSAPPTKSNRFPSTASAKAAPATAGSALRKTPGIITKGKPTPIPSSQGLPPPPYPPYPRPGAKTPYNQTQQAKFAAAHSSTKVSLTEAAKKRSQFGFGSHHVVPSVPMPMPNSAIGRAGTATGAAGKVPLVGNKRPLLPSHPAAPRPPMPVPPHIAQQQAAAAAAAAALAHKNRVNKALSNQAQMSSQTNSGPAYERKKQRAKDARIKLNEAIDHLSVAISLAGSQSTQRAQRLSSDAMKPPAVEEGGQDPIRTFRPKTVKIMETMGRTADQAKKWERPSFIGSAAEMVQGLNAQCEALMRELVVMNRLYREEVAKNGGNEVNVVKQQKDEKLSVVPVVSEGSHGETSPTAGVTTGLAADTVESSPCKKRKLSSATSLDALSTVLQEKLIRENFISFLDPNSLLQCRQVCGFWGDDAMFGADDPWLDILLKRFGFANVRKWQDKDDEEQEHNDPTSFALYRRMNEAVARPACLYEGNVRLGHGSVSGAIGAWATIVERSNGETLRSVRKQQSSTNIGGISFASLPVIEVRLLLQNMGVSDCSIVVPDQTLEVDASTRRRGETMSEITWDDRLSKKLIAADGTTTTVPSSARNATKGPDVPEMFRLNLFESTVLVAYIYAKSCTTTTKFRRRANSIKMLVSIRGITTTLVVPFKKSEGIDDDLSSTSSGQTKPDHPITEIVVKK